MKEKASSDAEAFSVLSKAYICQMQTVKITQIKPNPKNPRIIKDAKFEKLKKSIQDFPDMLNKRPLVCFTDADGKYVVLGGNMRLKAAQAIGMKELPIVLADEWTEEQKAEFLIKDNVGFGEWAWDELANEWDAEKLDEWGLDLPIFDTGGEGEAGGFDDEGIDGKNQYGVIVVCESAGTQESVYNDLIKMGFNCKVVVT
jgi:hypothetical protein